MLLKKTTINNTSVYSNITIRTTGIAWSAQKNNKFKMLNGGQNQWTNVTNERFIEWMRAPLRSNFFKLWGIIDQDLDIGLYRFDITNGSSFFIRCYLQQFKHPKITSSPKFELVGWK